MTEKKEKVTYKAGSIYDPTLKSNQPEDKPAEDKPAEDKPFFSKKGKGK